MNRSKLISFFLDDQIKMGVHLLYPQHYRFAPGVPNVLDTKPIESFQRLLKQQINLATRIYENTRHWVDCALEIELYKNSFVSLAESYQAVLASGVHVIGYEHELPALPTDLNLTPDEPSLHELQIDWHALFAQSESTREEEPEFQIRPESTRIQAAAPDLTFTKVEAPATETRTPPVARGRLFATSFQMAASTEAPSSNPGQLPTLPPPDEDKPKSRPKRKATSLDVSDAEKRRMKNKLAQQRHRDRETEKRQALRTEFAQLCAENTILQSTYMQLQTQLNALREQQGFLPEPLSIYSPPHTPTFFKTEVSTLPSKTFTSAKPAPNANGDGLNPTEKTKKDRRREQNREAKRRSEKNRKFELDKLTSKISHAQVKNNELRTIIRTLEMELNRDTLLSDDFEEEVLCSGTLSS